VPRLTSPVFTLITLVPLVWLLAVTVTAGLQKIWHPDPRIGFLAQAKILSEERLSLEDAVTAARTAGEAEAVQQAERALHKNDVLAFNNRLDAAVAAGFLVMVSAIVLLSVREWILLLGRRKPAVLAETEPVWLPAYAVAESRRPPQLAGLAAMAFALTKEFSGEADMERARQLAPLCESGHSEQGLAAAWPGGCSRNSRERVYLEVAEQRFNGIKHCC
jgi:carbon starvation protein